MIATACIALMLLYEAGDQSLSGKIAILNVVENRVNDKRWPNTHCEVINQPFQFSFLNDGKPEVIPIKGVDKEVYDNAVYLVTLMQENKLPKVVSNCTMYYHNDKIKQPYWAKKLKIERVIDNHIFYCDS